MTPKEMIAVLQAFEAGKEIQFRRKGSKGEWTEKESPRWGFNDFDYRVKPAEPKVLYINEYPGGSGYGVLAGHRSKEDAINAAQSAAIRKAVKYVEVIED